jgi:hypothetical protein
MEGSHADADAGRGSEKGEEIREGSDGDRDLLWTRPLFIGNSIANADSTPSASLTLKLGCL